MNISYDLNLEQQHNLIITPELKLALKILQLPSTELDEMVEKELEENPVLEIIEDVKEEKTEEEIDWKEYMQFQGKSYDSEESTSYDEIENTYENTVSYSFTLQDHLLAQLHLATESKETYRIGEFIIDSLDENGYLTISLQEISKLLKKDEKIVEESLAIVQAMEPVGVGARDLKECLLIQLKAQGITDEKIIGIVEENLDDIAANRIQLISKKFHISIEQAQQLSDIIKYLEPKPGRAFEGNTPTRYVVPDIYIEKVGDEYVITINDNYSNKLKINQYYKKILLSEEKTSEAAIYINDKLNSAFYLIKSLEQRKNTLYRVMNAILEYQIDFFEKGVMYLHRMTLKNIAEKIGVHESTVSRAVSSKYVQTPRGVFEVKYFFKSGVESEQGNSSSESIKTLVRQIINEEDITKPISDQEIADVLVSQGYAISRRTVAKYRDMMGINSSTKRKRF